jgi:hypothetical protein
MVSAYRTKNYAGVMRIRRVKTASGATAVQIVSYRHGQRHVIEHLGSAHDPAALAALESAAWEKINANQLAFDLELPEEDLTESTRPGRSRSNLVLKGTRSRLLWEVLESAYMRIFGHAVTDEVFTQMVIARVIEPTSKKDSLRVIGNYAPAPAPSYPTLKRRLKQIIDQQWRDGLCRAAYAYAAGAGAVSVVLYDATTLYFETDEEDETRKVGYSKERRVDPQIVVGLLVDKTGFPLDVHCFEGNTAETHTIIPVLDAFRARHGVEDILVVADAGMLSYANLQALEGAGYQYVVGTRSSKAPYDLAETFAARGNYFADGEIIEATTQLKKNVASSKRRAVWQYRHKREQRDRRNQTLQLQRAEDIAAGRKQQRKARFLTGGGPKTLAVDYEAAKRAQYYFGLKGYVTSASEEIMTGAEVIAAYHALFEVEASFRMAKSDLAARPIFHHTRDSIEAHLTIVFCALAIGRDLQNRSGASIKKIITTLEPVRDGIGEINGIETLIPAQVPEPARTLLNQLDPPH